MATLSALSLRQFRSHPASDLAPDPRPVAIWGANGAGKTNLLEAVSLLSPGRGLRRAPAEEMARSPGDLGWRVRAETRDRGIETGWEPGAGRTLRLDGKAAAQAALAGILRVVWLVPAQDRLWIEGAEGRRRFLDRIAMSFDPDHAPRSLAYEKAMRERNRLLRDGIDDPRWMGALEARMAEAAAGIGAARRDAIARLATAQAGAETAFPAAELTLQDDGPLDAGAFARAFAEGRPRDLAAGRSLTGPHRADLGAVYAAKGMPAERTSTGEQKALLVSLILANARALRAETGEAPLILLDEVAAHLDADRRAALFDEVCALGGQAWMTGTGPELFADLGPRAQGVEVTEAAGASRVAAREIGR